MTTLVTATKESKTAYHLSEVFGQSASGRRRFCRTERAAHDQTGHPSRAESVWPQAAHGLRELTPSICG